MGGGLTATPKGIHMSDAKPGVAEQLRIGDVLREGAERYRVREFDLVVQDPEADYGTWVALTDRWDGIAWVDCNVRFWINGQVVK